MRNKCPECGSFHLVQDFSRAEQVCQECGLVVDDNIFDIGPEWRAFDSDQRDKRARTGAPMTYTIHDKGLSTDIDWRNRDYQGRDISPETRSQIYRMRKWQTRMRISTAEERNLAFALTELNRLASHLRLPKNIREIAAVLYRKAIDDGLIRGRSIEGMAAACLYASCRQCRVPRTLDEFAEFSRIDKREIGRSYRHIAKELKIKLPPTSPTDYIPRFASELKVSSRVQQRSVEILERAMTHGLMSGKGPMGAAAAALYIASIQEDERRTQKEVSEVAKVTEVTVRNRYKEFQEELGIEVDV
ncbi:MAG: transcription initiation factor IIB [Candidatus Methanofastidiosia archaeon]